LIYLAINYGAYEGWKLTPYLSADVAIEAVKRGETYGSEWKILKEVSVKAIDEDA
jgi:hypothetical protein